MLLLDAFLVTIIGVLGVFVFLVLLVLAMLAVVRLLPPTAAELAGPAKRPAPSPAAGDASHHTIIAVLQAAVVAYEADQPQ